MLRISVPCEQELELKVGDQIELSGDIFCGRDAVLPQIVRLYRDGKLQEMGIDLRGGVIFHTAVSRAGIGPTSSNKLEIENSIPPLSEAGIKIHLGKGALRPDTVEALKRNRSFFAVTPPTTALFEQAILSREAIAFPEYGVEAFYRVRVTGLPAIIAVADGKSIFEEAERC